MKVEIITNHSSGLKVGQIKDLPTHIARNLIDRGIAIEHGLIEEKKEVKIKKEKKK